MTTTRTMDLTAERDDWVSMTIPGSDRAVRLARLFLHAPTNASVSLVEFPPGWRRPQIGHYEVAEEFVVLRGAITVSGQTSGAGDYALLPAGYRRVASEAPDGCLALAAFSGPPKWVVDETDGGGAVWGRAADARRSAGVSFPGEVGVLPAAPAGIEGSVEQLDLSAHIWCIATDGLLPSSSGPVFTRRWP